MTGSRFASLLRATLFYIIVDHDVCCRFCESGLSENPKAGSREFKFFRNQIELYGKLALNRNQYAIDVMTKKLKVLDWNQCFHILKASCSMLRSYCGLTMSMQDEHLPKSLRTRICQSISSLFVDVGDNLNVLAEVQLCFNWETLTRDVVCLFLTVVD